MKITIDTTKGELKAKGKAFELLSDDDKNLVLEQLNKYRMLGRMTDYEEDSMWMSYRYCIGRQTIAAHYRAYDIKKNCYGRMTKERSEFTAFDINREIEQLLQHCAGPNFYFPGNNGARINIPALDAFCEFCNEYNISSTEELLNYKTVIVNEYDNERGYAFEVTTWKEWENTEYLRLCNQNNIDPDEGPILPLSEYSGFEHYYKVLDDHKLRYEYFYLTTVNDLFVWNDLMHIFDIKNHHKSKLKDGTEVEWVWTYAHATIDNNDGTYKVKDIGYQKIRIPIDKWNGTVTTYIPDDCIEEEIY